MKTVKKSLLEGDLREIAIPKRAEDAGCALDYHAIDIDFTHPLSREELVRATDYGLAQQSYYARSDGLNAPYHRQFKSATNDVWLRVSVAEKLKSANDLLCDYGAEVLLLDGYRSIEVQREVWDYFMQQARHILHTPSEEECVAFAGLYCSDPRAFNPADSRTWPTHTTGGAVDLCLRARATKEPLFFGSIFDDPSPVTFTDHFEHQVDPSASAREARRNRRLLYWAMTDVGLINFPYEWWHFDFGTQLATLNGSSSQPVYGYTEPPE